MIFPVVFLINTAANFAFGIVLSAMLGPAEFGRYATASLAALTLGTALFDWLRNSSLRFSGDVADRATIAASLDAGYLAMIALAIAGVALAGAAGFNFGLTPTLLALTPLLAIAASRCDYAGAQLRARDQGRAFAGLYVLRQALTFTFVFAVAAATRDSAVTIAALSAANLIPVVVFATALRTGDASLALTRRRHIRDFAIYAAPLVASSVIYQLIALLNRQAALEHLGAAATGELSLATDMGQRVFMAVNALPEMLLFQQLLRVERNDGTQAAQRQAALNFVLVFAVLAPLTTGYMAMAPTFEALVVPAAYRGDFARLTFALAPGLFAFSAVHSMFSHIFQLAKRTWPLTLASLAALGADAILLRWGGADASIDALAWAYTASLGVGLVVAMAQAMREAKVWPSLRDCAVVAIATAAMTLAIRPLNGVGTPAVAGVLALGVGGAIYGGAMWAFDVGGFRAIATSIVRGLLGRKSSGEDVKAKPPLPRKSSIDSAAA